MVYIRLENHEKTVTAVSSRTQLNLAIVIFVGMILTPLVPQPAVAQPDSSNEISPDPPSAAGHQIYGCTLYDGVNVPCDPIINKFRVFDRVGVASQILPLINEAPGYVDGINGLGLELAGRERESIEIVNAEYLNPPQFSVAFWMKIGQDIEPYGHIISHLNSRYTSGWSFEMQRTPGSEDAKLFFRVTSRNGSLGHTETTVPFNTFVNVIGTFN